jgi:5'-nucleotidase, C-terminal domain
VLSHPRCARTIVYTDGLRESAEKYVPQMRAEGAQIVVALSHGGLDASPYAPSMENGSYYLSTVPGIEGVGIRSDGMARNSGAALQSNRSLTDIGSGAGQQLPRYNFDMITSPDFSYEIDVTQPVGNRIRNLSYKGAPAAGQPFIVASNNYRASGGGHFPGLDGSKTIYASPDANRDVLISYIKRVKAISSTVNGGDRSWRFTKVAKQGPVTFKSAPNLVALAQSRCIGSVAQLQTDDGSGENLAEYSVDLSQ